MEGVEGVQVRKACCPLLLLPPAAAPCCRCPLLPLPPAPLPLLPLPPAAAAPCSCCCSLLPLLCSLLKPSASASRCRCCCVQVREFHNPMESAAQLVAFATDMLTAARQVNPKNSFLVSCFKGSFAVDKYSPLICHQLLVKGHTPRQFHDTPTSCLGDHTISIWFFLFIPRLLLCRCACPTTRNRSTSASASTAVPASGVWGGEGRMSHLCEDATLLTNTCDILPVLTRWE